MKIIVTADSTADVPQKFQKEFEIIPCPLIVNLGDEDFYDDGVSITSEKIFDYVDKTGSLPKTAARSVESYKEYFEQVKKEHKADRIIHISLSSELSSTCQNSKLAAEELGYVGVVDSLSLSTGSGLIALSAGDKIKEGKPFEQILEELKEEVPRVQASFIISNLNYLHKGGRCSAVAVFGANVLRIKPKIKLFDGKMIVDRKYIGKYEVVIEKYVNDLLSEYKNPVLDRAFVTYTTENKALNEMITKKLEAAGFKQIICNLAGATITSHCGKDTLGVLFINGEKA